MSAVICSSEANMFCIDCPTPLKDLPANSSGDLIFSATVYSETLGLKSIISVFLKLLIVLISLE